MEKKNLLVTSLIVLLTLGVGWFWWKWTAAEQQISSVQAENAELESELAAIKNRDRELAAAESRDARRKADLSELRTALELYFDDQLAYPVTDSFAELSDWITPVYMLELPEDPTAAQSYRYQGTASEFQLSATLEATDEEYVVKNAYWEPLDFFGDR